MVLFGRDGTGQQMAGHVFFYLSRQQLAARLPFGHLDAGGHQHSQLDHLLDRCQMLQRWMIANRP